MIRFVASYGQVVDYVLIIQRNFTGTWAILSFPLCIETTPASP